MCQQKKYILTYSLQLFALDFALCCLRINQPDKAFDTHTHTDISSSRIRRNSFMREITFTQRLHTKKTQNKMKKSDMEYYYLECLIAL